MWIPFIARRGATELSRQERRRRRPATHSSEEHLSAVAGRDVDSLSGSTDSQLSSRLDQELPGSWVGAPSYSNMSWVCVSITAYGRQMEATPFGYGGGPITVIPPNQPFSGRESGGGTRAEVYGNSYYGSGYPGQQRCGVDGRGFPFVFWPVVYTAPEMGAGAAYLYREVEYGRTDNSTRPGAALQQSTFYTNRSTFRLITDTTTSTYLYYAS